jgi:hypothetical protein
VVSTSFRRRVTGRGFDQDRSDRVHFSRVRWREMPAATGPKLTVNYRLPSVGSQRGGDTTPFEFADKYHQLWVEDSLLGLNVNLNISKYKADWAQEDVNEASAVLDLVAKRFLRLRGAGDGRSIHPDGRCPPDLRRTGQTRHPLAPYRNRPEPDRELKLRDALHGRMGRKGASLSTITAPIRLH